MLKRVITAAVGVVGLVLVGLGVASATLWRADDVLVATASGGAHTYVTDPGVLEMGGDPATVRITAPDDAHVVLAMGRDTDVTAWIGSDPHARVTGLSSWHDLATTTAAPKPTPAATATAGATATPTPKPTPTPTGTAAASAGGAATAGTAADPTGSDMWVQESAGNGSASLTWQAQPGRWSLIAVSTGAAAPTLSISWPRVVTTPWLWPLVVIGLVLVLGAVAMFLWDVRRRRRGPDADWTPVTTGAIPAVEGEPTVVLTRRQLREAAQARAARPRTGATPVVSSPETTPVPATPRAGAGESTQPTSAATSNRPGAPASPSAAVGRPSDPSTAAAVGQHGTTGPNAPVTGPVPTSRRALRAAGAGTGATPVVAPRPAGAHESPTAVQPPVQAADGAAATAGTPAGASPTRAPGANQPASAGAASARAGGATPPAPAGAAPSPTPGVTPPAPAGGTLRPTSATGAPVKAAGAPTPPTPAGPASGVTAAGDPSHHARPTWLPVPPESGAASPATEPQATPAPAPTGATQHPRWLGTHNGPEAGPPASPVLPPPGPQRGAGDTNDEPDAGGSRADAWRRAWGLPPVDRDDATNGEGRDGR